LQLTRDSGEMQLVKAAVAHMQGGTLVIPSLKTFHGHASDGWKNDPERRNENEKHAGVGSCHLISDLRHIMR
jgi:hypothetical protein